MAEKVDPTRQRHSTSPLLLFASTTILLLVFYQWPRRWAISGVPALQLIVLLGSSQGSRILPGFHLWPVFTTLNLVYAICSTSWLLYWLFASLCYLAIFITCLFQFSWASNMARKTLRKMIIEQLHFVDDKVAFFNIPALEIDTDVDGLMVIRGVTFCLSTLTFLVHGVEVGIKLSDDMELAIQTEMVEIKLFRSIWVGDCFANLKGGKYEMTFGELEGKNKDIDGDQVLVEGTPLLKAASRSSMEQNRYDSEEDEEENIVKMTDHMTNGKTLEDSTTHEGLKDIETLSPDNDFASKRYRETLSYIQETSTIGQARQYLKSVTDAEIHSDPNTLRAAVCSRIHSDPSVPHPPKRSIRVSTIKKSSSPQFKRLLHRLPMLLRLLLNPLSYFHPVHFSSITATASGAWIDSILLSKVFKDYWQHDHEIRLLKERLSSWLSDANFAVELGSILGLAQVPFLSNYNINCNLQVEDVMAYRTLPKQIHLNQVVLLGGADANFVVPSFLLPHHEHILPPLPTSDEKQHLQNSINDAGGKPKTLQAQTELAQKEKDETNVKISVHARLPAVFDQELLDFIAALVKATKVVEIEKAPSAMDEEVSGIKDFGRALRGGVREGVKKVVVDGVVNDRWIAKMVGKITRKLEEARGDVGYSGDIPVALEKYRNQALPGEKLDKILP